MQTIVKINKDHSIARLKCNLPDDITGIEYSKIENAVMFFRFADGLVGFAHDDGTVHVASKRLEVKTPSGMCCDAWGTCVLQFSNDMLWEFDQSYKSGHRLFGSVPFKTLSNILPKNANSYRPYGICRLASDRVAIAIPWGNRVMFFSRSNIVEQIGSGKRGFLSSNSVKAAMLNSPVGVCFDSGSSMLLVSDTGNSIIRMFHNGKEHACIGMPGKSGSLDGRGTFARLSAPSFIKSDKGIAVFVDKNDVKTIKINTLEVSTIYISSHRNKIVNLAMGNDSIYILEDDNEPS